MRVQLWSYNYDPEPQGIAPLSAALALQLQQIGHDVSVVAAHPHYPEPVWGRRIRPYRERRSGVPVYRLPLWAGRASGFQRMRQEVTFTAALTGVAPFLPPADAVVAVTPSLPALAPAVVMCRLRRIPLIIWLQDIVTDGAATTGELADDGAILRGARSFERWTYDAAERIVVISGAFRENLVEKGVRESKVQRIFNPSSREAPAPVDVDALLSEPPRLLAMGNIGHSQGLDRIVQSFEQNRDLAARGATLSIAGGGVAADDVRNAITTDRVTMHGVLYGDQLTPLLSSSVIGVVSQRPGITEFNLPSKLMTYMACGVPVIASVAPDSETARIVRESGAGWVTDAADPEQFAATAAAALGDPAGLRAAARAGYAFAQREFSPASIAARFDGILRGLVEPPAPSRFPQLGDEHTPIPAAATA